jgi:hypothetical protein
MGALALQTLPSQCSWQNIDYAGINFHVDYQLTINPDGIEPDTANSQRFKVFYYSQHAKHGCLFPSSHPVTKQKTKVSFAFSDKMLPNGEYTVVEAGYQPGKGPYFTINARDDSELSCATHVLVHNFVFFECTMPPFLAPVNPTGFYFLGEKHAPGCVTQYSHSLHDRFHLRCDYDSDSLIFADDGTDVAVLKFHLRTSLRCFFDTLTICIMSSTISESDVMAKVSCLVGFKGFSQLHEDGRSRTLWVQFADTLYAAAALQMLQGSSLFASNSLSLRVSFSKKLMADVRNAGAGSLHDADNQPFFNETQPLHAFLNETQRLCTLVDDASLPQHWEVLVDQNEFAALCFNYPNPAEPVAVSSAAKQAIPVGFVVIDLFLKQNRPVWRPWQRLSFPGGPEAHVLPHAGLSQQSLLVLFPETEDFESVLNRSQSTELDFSLIQPNLHDQKLALNFSDTSAMFKLSYKWYNGRLVMRNEISTPAFARRVPPLKAEIQACPGARIIRACNKQPDFMNSDERMLPRYRIASRKLASYLDPSSEHFAAFSDILQQRLKKSIVSGGKAVAGGGIHAAPPLPSPPATPVLAAAAPAAGHPPLLHNDADFAARLWHILHNAMQGSSKMDQFRDDLSDLLNPASVHVPAPQPSAAHTTSPVTPTPSSLADAPAKFAKGSGLGAAMAAFAARKSEVFLALQAIFVVFILCFCSPFEGDVGLSPTATAVALVVAIVCLILNAFV